MREENVKHFDLGNGQYHAVSYSYPVHELDSEGNWVDINTALTTGNARSLGQYATEDGRVTVSQTFRPNSQILSMQEDGKGIAMSMVADSSNVSTFSMSRAAVENAPVRTELTEYATIEEATSGDYGSRVYYEDVLPDTDLEYIVDIDMVKENIIVKAAQESYRYSYTFALDLTGLYAQLEDEGSVSLIDTATQERKYMIPAPYMYDALGNTSFDAAYTLTQEENTCYLTVTADAEWINTQGCQFPVTIDPSVMGVSNTTEDTYIDSLYPAENYGDARALWARVNRISYFQWNLPSFPERADLDSAYLSVHYGYLNTVESGYVHVGVYRVTMPWQEDALTYGTASNYTSCGIDNAVLHDEHELYAGQGATLSSPDEQRFYITPVADAWFDGWCPNYGVALKYLGGTNLSVVFKSRETESQYRPCFHYEYTVSTPVTRYIVNYYDTTVAGDATAIAYMDDAIDFAYTVFYNNFDVQFLSDGTPTQYENAPVDVCDYGSTSGCDSSNFNCGGLCSSHHKNILKISQGLRENGLSNRVYTLWGNSGNTIYCEGTDIHVTVSEEDKAVVCDNSNAIQVYKIEGSNSDQIRAYMAITLAHELVHTLGMDDDYTGAHISGGEYQCLMDCYRGADAMDDFYADILQDPDAAFCESCKNTLTGYIAGLS